MMWLAAAVTLLCWLAIFWAAPRGFDFTDDAAALFNIAHASNFHAMLSSYGRLWHPLYVLVGGDITLLRLADALILAGCASIFAQAVTRFAFFPQVTAQIKGAVFSAMLVGVLWRYDRWLPTPNYNSLTLAGLLLFASTLLFYVAPRDEPRWRRYDMGLALMAGAVLAIVGLTKASSAVAMAILGLVWLGIMRPRDSAGHVVVTAITCLAVLVLAATLMEGSVPAFVHSLRQAYYVQTLRETGSDFHGIRNSIVQPFLDRYILKSLKVGAAGCLLIALAYTAVFFGGHERVRSLAERILACTTSAGLSALIAWWRIQNVLDPKEDLIAYAWYFAVPAAFCAVLLWTWPSWQRACTHHRSILVGAVMVGLVPFAFAFGTDNPIYLAATQAAVFWMAASILLCTLLPEGARERSISAIVFLFAIVTAGMLAGVAGAPGRIGGPLWQQSEIAVIGPGRSRLRVTAATADFLKQAHEIAAIAHLAPTTPILNVTDTGPGLPFALGGTSPGLAWLRWDGQHPLEYPKEAIRANGDIVDGAWLITEARAGAIGPAMLMKGGIGIRGPYRPLGHIRHRVFGWDLVLWCPMRVCGH